MWQTTLCYILAVKKKHLVIKISECHCCQSLMTPILIVQKTKLTTLTANAQNT